MSKPNPAIGKMKCMLCGEPLTVKKAESGTINLSCPDCDLSAYAKPGTEAHRTAMARIILKATPLETKPVEPTPVAKPVVKLPGLPSPEVIRKNTVFG